MHLTRVLSLVSVCLFASCGASDQSEPPDVYEALGLSPGPLPPRWIDTLDATQDGSRDYYEGILAYLDNVTVRSTLILNLDAHGKPETYELAEYYLETKADQTGLDLVKTVESSGAVSIEEADPDSPPIYRLDGGSNPELARSFVRVGDQLRVAILDDEGRVVGAQDLYNLLYVASATRDAVMISEQVDIFLNWRTRLRVGDELTARLEQTTSSPWSLHPGSEGSVVALDASHTEDRGGVMDPDHPIQLIRLKAVAVGWTDLKFDSGIVSVSLRVKVE